jgi:hypothetical protein
VPAELLRLRCRGHPAIRATHAKTLEFTADADISRRATCVVGVGATVVGTPPPRLAGPVRITISVGEHSAVVRALANSRWRAGGGAVVRRSSERLPNTLATDADRASAELPRPLIAALTDPTAAVEIIVAQDTRTDQRLVRYRAGPGRDDRLAAECLAGDAIVAEDAAARSLLAAYGAACVSGEHAVDVLAMGGRVLAVSTSDMTIKTAPVRRMLAARPAVEVLGVSPELAVAAASPHSGPVVVATAAARADVVHLAAAHRSSTVVFRCPARELSKRITGVARAVGTRDVAVLPAGSAVEQPVWGPVGTAGELIRSGDVLCALDPLAGFPPPHPVGLAAPALLAALLTHDVPSKMIIRALADQPGWSHQRAYDYVLRIKHAEHSQPNYDPHEGGRSAADVGCG